VEPDASTSKPAGDLQILGHNVLDASTVVDSVWQSVSHRKHFVDLASLLNWPAGQMSHWSVAGFQT